LLINGIILVLVGTKLSKMMKWGVTNVFKKNE
jgi:hypothetical protein